MVDRVIVVEKPVPVVERVEVPMAPKRGDRPELLRDLAGQIDAGRVCDRDLPDVAEGLEKPPRPHHTRSQTSERS